MTRIAIGSVCLALVCLGAQAGTVQRVSGLADDLSPTAPAVCSPLPGATDVFSSTAKLVLQANFFGQPFVVRLSSSGQPDAQVQRFAQSGNTINTQILQMQLSGFDTTAGAITLRRNTAQTSAGQIRNVVQDGACAFAGGDASFDMFVEIDVGTLGETWINQVPVHLEAKLTQLPPVNVAFEVLNATPVQLVNKATLQPRGQLLYAQHLADPNYPPAGADCFDSLFTSNVKIFSSGLTSMIFGFGPTAVERGPEIPGGFCQIGGAACQTNGNCGLGNPCVGPHIDTEMTSMSLAGFDTALGSFTVRVAPAGTSNCCASHAGSGCNDPTCQQLVCGTDPFCCSSQWDALCASQAQSQPTCVANCTNPNAAPSTGKVQSTSNAKTYPGSSFFDVFVEIDSSTKGTLHNTAPIKVNAIGGVRNQPPDAQTIFRYASAPVTLYSSAGSAVGEISSVDQTVQTPRDCAPPPSADDDCLLSKIQVQLTVPPCAMETLVLPGQFRMLRGNPYDPGGFGQKVIDTLMAKMAFSGTGSCLGPLTVRLAPASASTGKASALTPEEFFPADSFFDVSVAVDGPFGTLTGAGPLHTVTTINALAPDPGEVYFGPVAAINLLNGVGAVAGQLTWVSQEIQGSATCLAEYRSAIKFVGPGKNNLDVSIPGAGAGVQYDVVRGDLSELRSTGGTFSSAFCQSTDSGPLVTDSATPGVGAAYYYVARDGFGAYNGTWNSLGLTQQGDRDTKIGSCP